MTNIKAEAAIQINISPYGFQLAARDFFKCFLDFEKPDRPSVVPYFLCCRAIELALKSLHLETQNRSEVKNNYRHNLIKSYDDLPAEKRILSTEEYRVLKQADKIYSNKEFEYFSVSDAATGFKRYPNLDALGKLARKLTGYDS